MSCMDQPPLLPFIEYHTKSVNNVHHLHTIAFSLIDMDDLLCPLSSPTPALNRVYS